MMKGIPLDIVPKTLDIKRKGNLTLIN